MASGSMARRRRIDDHMVLVKDETVKGHHTYKVDQLVGSGAYAAVYRAYDELGRVVALKEYFPASHPRDIQQLKILFEREKYVLTQVSPHPLMPTFFEAFEYRNQMYIAQEFIEGNTLDYIIYHYKKLDRDWMLKWAINLCDALTFLHERCIVHHDLKPANLKINPEGHLVVLDYGAAQYFGEPKDDVPDVVLSDGELYGTEGYLPPEVEETFVADVQTDIFALGCILYEMVMGIPPEQQRINERNLAVTTPLTQRRDVDLAYVKLVTTALSYNTEYRFASAQLFLQELRKISPPVPMVTHKSLYFGIVDLQAKGAVQKFRIYNSGPPVELQGEIICKAPWLKVDVPKFRGKRRDVAVVLDPTRVTEFNVPLKGDVEVHTKETRSPDGALISKADKWVVHCYVTVKAKPITLSIEELKDKDASLTLKAAKGFAGKRSFSITNRGELVGDFYLAARNPELGISFEPAQLKLSGQDGADVVMSFKPNGNTPPGDTKTEIVAMSGERELAIFPVTLRVVSFFDYLKVLLGLAK